jgi:6-phosphogluconolactonase (cycloisomerase 2 family)
MRLPLVGVLVLAVVSGGLGACGGGGGGGQIARTSLSGTVNGLRGSGLAVAVNAGTPMPLVADGAFTLPVRIPVGSTYHVSVVTQPKAPSQTCVIANGDGQAGASNISSVTVTCSTDRFTVGGSVIRLTGSGLVLQDNGGDDLRVSADGRFVFATPVGSGAAYDVTVLAQPTNPAQTCYVTRGSGVIDVAAVDDVLVNCHPRIQTVTGTATGITGTGIVLRNNGGDDLVIASHGPFAFSTAMATGDEYHVTVDQQPTDAARHCSVSNGVGIVGAAGVSDIRVQCTVVGRRIYVPTWAPLENSLTYPGIYMFSWDPATERFQLLPGSPIPYGAHIAVAPDGTFAVVHLWRPGTVINRLALYGINLTGELVPVPDVATLPLDATLMDAAIDPSSKYLYFVQSGDARVFAYGFNATGSLMSVPGGPFGMSGSYGGNHLAFDPQGRFLFVANASARTISAFAIDRGTGALAEFVGSPYSLAFEPQDLNVESQGRYLYVTSPTAQLVPYVIDGFDGSTGALRPASAAPFAPTSLNGGRYGFDPNSDRILYLAWCSGACRCSGPQCPGYGNVTWGLWRLAVGETGAVHPLGDFEYWRVGSEFEGYESPQFDSSGNFVCFLSQVHGVPYGSSGCFLIDATTGALGRQILYWDFSNILAGPFAITR